MLLFSVTGKGLCLIVACVHRKKKFSFSSLPCVAWSELWPRPGDERDLNSSAAARIQQRRLLAHHRWRWQGVLAGWLSETEEEGPIKLPVAERRGLPRIYWRWPGCSRWMAQRDEGGADRATHNHNAEEVGEAPAPAGRGGRVPDCGGSPDEGIARWSSSRLTWSPPAS
jgi:hypothetical protein